jgi:hypothetical protein
MSVISLFFQYIWLINRGHGDSFSGATSKTFGERVIAFKNARKRERVFTVFSTSQNRSGSQIRFKIISKFVRLILSYYVIITVLKI